MKILITTDWYTPAVNGVVTSVKNLQRELERRGHEVRILTLSQSLHSWSRDGVTAIGSVNAGRIYPGARLRTAMAGRWVRELMDWRPDVIHSQCEFSTFFLARRIAEELDVPLVHTYHTVYEDYTHYFSPSVRWGRCAVAAFSRWVAAQVDGMIAPTGKVRGLLQGYGRSLPGLRGAYGHRPAALPAGGRSHAPGGSAGQPGHPCGKHCAGVRGAPCGGEEHPGAAEAPGLPGQPPCDAVAGGGWS